MIDPAAANERAIRAYAKVGFKPAGVLRRSWRGPDGILGGSAADGSAGRRAHVSPSSRFAIRPSRIVNAFRSGGSLASDTIR